LHRWRKVSAESPGNNFAGGDTARTEVERQSAWAVDEPARLIWRCCTCGQLESFACLGAASLSRWERPWVVLCQVDAVAQDLETTRDEPVDDALGSPVVATGLVVTMAWPYLEDGRPADLEESTHVERATTEVRNTSDRSDPPPSLSIPLRPTRGRRG